MCPCGLEQKTRRTYARTLFDVRQYFACFCIQALSQLPIPNLYLLTFVSSFIAVVAPLANRGRDILHRGDSPNRLDRDYRFPRSSFYLQTHVILSLVLWSGLDGCWLR
jgi:hypothetical protein